MPRSTLPPTTLLNAPSHPSPQPRSSTDAWLTITMLASIILAVSLLLFTFWASSKLLTLRRRQRRRRCKARAEGTELGRIPEAGQRVSETGGADRKGREQGGNGIGNGSGYAVGFAGKGAGIPALPLRVYRGRVEERLDGMAPVEGVEMV
ncbi:MAG: hypothetical protein Q9161_005929 [Pseudevernia consocians]